jgi:hypothetical protein
MSQNLLGGVTMAQAAANLSALSCPSAHRNAVSVEDLDGETVAALCLDCDKQLPPEWAPPPPRDYVAEHEKDHHGHPAVFLLACRECTYECNPSYRNLTC